tara:strand:+ start:2133 stop:2312 length:180 start_codon:yes stop_codon:yes gene_type:complete
MEKNQEELWDYMVEMNIATDDELSLVCSINGTTLESMESVLYVKTGYRSLKQVTELNEY